MRTKDLIAKLQALVDEHAPYVESYGEHEIMIDLFSASKEDPYTFNYAGISTDISIDVTGDGVYHVLSAFDPKDYV